MIITSTAHVPQTASGKSVAPATAEPPRDEYRPFAPVKNAGRWATQAAPFVMAGVGLAASQLSGWGGGVAGAVIGAPVGLVAGLVVGGGIDLIRAIGGKKKPSYMAILSIGGALITGGVAAYLCATGNPLGMPVMAGIGFLEGGAIAIAGRLAMREKKTQARQIFEELQKDPQKYASSEQAIPFLNQVYDLEKKGWEVHDANGAILSYAEAPTPGQSINVKKGGSWNSVSLEQLGTLISPPDDDKMRFLRESFAEGKLIATREGANQSYRPDEKDQGWWEAEHVKAYHELKTGGAVHLCHKEISFTYDPAAAPPWPEFFEDAKATADAYETAFRDAFSSYKLSSGKAQQLCSRMQDLVESGRYPDLESAGKALAGWASQSGKGGSDENTEALLSLTDPGRLAPSAEVVTRLLDQLSPQFGLAGVERVANHLKVTNPASEERFVRLAKAIGDLPQTIRLDSIMSTVSPEAYEGYVGVCEAFSEGGKRSPQDLLFDFALLAAYSNGPQDIGNQARSYAQIFQPLAELGQAEEAAPTYVFLRESGIPAEKFLAKLAETKKAGEALQALAPAPATHATEAALPTDEELRPFFGYDSRDAIDHLRTQQARLDEPGFERYKGAFGRVAAACKHLPTAVRATQVLQNLQPDLAERHLKVLEGLAGQRGEPGPETLMDYLCVVAGRDATQSLESAAKDYGDLLHGVSQLGLPDEAAPTFALIRHAQIHGKADGASTHELTARYLKSLLLTRDGERSRQQLFAAEAGTSSVKEDDQGVVVGGVRIKRRK